MPTPRRLAATLAMLGQLAVAPVGQLAVAPGIMPRHPEFNPLLDGPSSQSGLPASGNRAMSEKYYEDEEAGATALPWPLVSLLGAPSSQSGLDASGEHAKRVADAPPHERERAYLEALVREAAQGQHSDFLAELGRVIGAGATASSLEAGLDAPSSQSGLDASGENPKRVADAPPYARQSAYLAAGLDASGEHPKRVADAFVGPPITKRKRKRQLAPAPGIMPRHPESIPLLDASTSQSGLDASGEHPKRVADAFVGPPITKRKRKRQPARRSPGPTLSPGPTFWRAIERATPGGNDVMTEVEDIDIGDLPLYMEEVGQG